MDLKKILNSIADQADNTLRAVSTRKDAQTVLTETLESSYADLDSDERLIVVARVMEILEKEDFFAADPTESDSVWNDGADVEKS